MAIILARHGTPAARLERTVIQDEDYLQKYIYEHPDVLPLDQLQGQKGSIVYPCISEPAAACESLANYRKR